ncbi:hypothetical protein Tco_1105272 [Tanacetum coccineum]
MDPSRSWAPRWLNKEQSVFYLIIRRMKTNTNSGVVSVQPAEVVTSQQDTCNVVHVRDISENGQREIGKDHCFTSFAILIKKNNCSAGGRIEPVETPSAQEKGCVNALEEFIHLISERESKNFRVRRHDNDHVVTLHQLCKPRYKYLASFMMPIARMLARIDTILAPYGQISANGLYSKLTWNSICQEMKDKAEASDKAFEEARS